MNYVSKVVAADSIIVPIRTEEWEPVHRASGSFEYATRDDSKEV